MSKKITKQELLPCIDFFNKLTVTEEDVTTDQQRANGQLVVKATYQYEGKRFTTPELYYKDITHLDKIVRKQEILQHFGSPIYWLDIHEHEWPESWGAKLERAVLPDMGNNDEEFLNLLTNIANDHKTGFGQKLTKQGRGQFYSHKLENNNHWHDIVRLIKAVIKSKGKKVDKSFFKRLVYDNNDSIRKSLYPPLGDWAIVSKLYKNIRSIQMELDIKEYTELLKHKHQIILQGPPGTGKTYTAKDVAEEIIFGEKVAENKDEQRERLEESERYKLIQFHPAYTYEDFVRGITVEAKGSNVNYKSENRVLGAFAKVAAKPENKDKNYVLVIDEINRANLPAVLGELIYALEYRGHAVESMYKVDGGDNKLLLPENLYIIGTMNTADRSVGHIDYAIRRRFAFKSILPQRLVIENHYKSSTELSGKATKLFDEVSKLFVADNNSETPKTDQPERSANIAQDFAPEDVWLGHSYFMAKLPKKDDGSVDEAEALRRLELKLQYEIKPLLREYLKDGILLEKSELQKPDEKGKWTVKEYIEDLQVS